MTGKTHAPWWAHVMLYAGGLTTVVAGGAAAVAQYGLDTANGAVEHEDILGDNRAEVDVENLAGPLDILVLGVDEQGGSTRSDTMIMVHVNEDLTDVAMVSLPRDLLVPIPDCGPDWGNGPCEYKLNHAASISDDWDVTRSNVVETIDDLTGVQFHLGATVNFEGFLDLVDMVGEIELCPWHEITSIHGDRRTFPEGCAYYDKDESLDLVRQRKAWGRPSDWESGRGGDYGRQAMQQQAIKSLLREAKAQGFHKDPTKLTGLLDGFGSSLKLDLPPGLEVTDLVVNLRDLDPDHIDSIRVPASGEKIDGIDYEVTHVGTEEQIAADALWEALRNDTVDQWMLQYPEWVKSDT
ncbi:LCP family protein [Glycomyces sp. L485]|uniref:LCP family protein n=1 Tax=Glycomyces sp. L485 TaxID=2909235 RepID=UPI001F4A4115|nr:LCP family protein [Glycomyces sp. L485]MCH7229448.1 LCP family protein [Glycomyces sp. L485]